MDESIDQTPPLSHIACEETRDELRRVYGVAQHARKRAHQVANDLAVHVAKDEAAHESVEERLERGDAERTKTGAWWKWGIAQFAVVAIGVGGFALALDRRVTSGEAKLEAVERRLEAVESSLDRLGSRMDILVDRLSAGRATP